MERHLNPSLVPYTNYHEGVFRMVEADNFNSTILQPIDSKTLRELNLYIDTNKDTSFYSSIGLFNPTSKRATENNVIAITQHIVDIDSHGLQESITKQEAQALTNYLIQVSEAGELPRPSLIKFTGRGLHISWNLKETKGEPQNIELWKATQKGLIKRLNDLLVKFKEGAFINFMHINNYCLSEALTSTETDSKIIDAQRVMRMCNSTNLKANKSVEALFISEAVYTQETFIKGFNFEVKASKKGKVVNIEELLKCSKELEKVNGSTAKFKAPHLQKFSTQVLRRMRLRDMFTLIRMRNARGWFKGYRNELIAIVMQLVREEKKSPAVLLNEVLAYNDTFKIPLEEREINRTFKSCINSPQKYYRTETIVEILDISMEEQQGLKALISHKEKNRRYYQHEKNSRLEAKEKALSERYSTIIYFRQKGATVENIANMLNLSVRTIKYNIKTLKENGLL